MVTKALLHLFGFVCLTALLGVLLSSLSALLDTPSFAHGQQLATDTADRILPTQSNTLLSQPIFREEDADTVTLQPQATGSTTNLIFYIQCPSVACPDNGTVEVPVYIFNNETLARGDLPFSEYWQPPAFTEYIIMEYRNDAQQFSCSGISWEACRDDAHFVSLAHFSLVANSTTITPEMLAVETVLHFRISTTQTRG